MTLPALESQEIERQLAGVSLRFSTSEAQMKILDAYHFASSAHEGQFRRSGEQYIHHPVAVAGIVAGILPDVDAVVAALLHDAIEDTSITREQIEESFGEEVAVLVDGLTKLDKLKFDTQVAQQAATVRKMFVAMSQDIRVIIIKLADRLHNLLTLAAMPAANQERTAQETLDLYAPLAHRLGMQELRQQMEDLAFAALHPKRYAEIDHLVSERTPQREEYIADVTAAIREILDSGGIEGDVSGRSKHYWSIYEKMVVKQKTFDDINDLVGVRIVVGDIRDCYAALGAVHARWTPVQGRFKDYIATPKFNLYRSLHTTVIGPQGKPLEVQIRTREMHQIAEHGVAAHWEYKNGTDEKTNLPWVKHIVDWQEDVGDPEAFMSMLKIDLEQDEVFVFTPKGKVVTLPTGSTPVDFAYSIHSEVGDRCVGAKVNGKLAPLSTVMASGDTIEVLTGKEGSAGPSLDWLKFVATNRAKSKIKQWHSKGRREEEADAGLDMLLRALRKEGLPANQIRHSETLVMLAESMNYTSVESLYAAIGGGHVSAEGLAEKIRRTLEDGDEETGAGQRIPLTVTRKRTHPKSAKTSGVHVEGLDDIMVKFAQCCQPIPGDRIIGYVTKGQGVSVHTTECTNIHQMVADDMERVIDVDWDTSNLPVSEATLEVKALDRTGLLGDIAASLSSARTNIISCATITDVDQISTLRFVVQLSDTSQLDSALQQIRLVESVYDAYRISG